MHRSAPPAARAQGEFRDVCAPLRPRAARAGAPGITLLEMLVVVAIISLMVGLAYPGVSRSMDRIRLRVAADDVAAFLAQAMNRTQRDESPVELRFLKTQATIEMAGPHTAPRALHLPDGVFLAEIYPVPTGGREPDSSILLLPGGAFPSLTVELATRSAGKRDVSIDPVTGAPVVGVAQFEGAVAP